MIQANKQSKLNIFLVGILVIFLGFFSWQILAKYEQVRAVKTIFEKAVGVSPPEADIKRYVADFEPLLLAEEQILRAIYLGIINKELTAGEVAEIRAAYTSAEDLRQELFRSEERVAAIQELYQGLLGRSAVSAEVDFYVKTQTSIPAIVNTLNYSEERLDNIKKIFQVKLGREPSSEELEEILFAQTYLLDISKNF